MGSLGLTIYHYAASKEEHFHKGILAYFKSFTLPWFAVLGGHKARDHDLGFSSAILVGLLATAAGGVYIDLFSRSHSRCRTAICGCYFDGCSGERGNFDKALTSSLSLWSLCRSRSFSACGL